MTVMIISGDLTDGDMKLIADMVHALDNTLEIASGPIVQVGVDRGDGRIMRVGIRWFFDLVRRGVLDTGPAFPAGIHSRGVRLE